MTTAPAPQRAEGEAGGSRIEGAFTAVIAALGAWGLLAGACVLAGLDFATLRVLAPLPLVVVPILVWRSRPEVVATPIPAAAGAGSPLRLPTAYHFGAPLLIAAVYAWTTSPWVFWVLAVGYATVELLAPPAAEAREARRSLAREGNSRPRIIATLATLVALALIAALLTAGASRPDPDDAYFVSVAVSSIEAPEAPLLGFDGMHRDGLPPVEQALHQTQVYELLVAVAASLSGVPVAVLYYLVLPPLWAVLALVAHWVALRGLLPRTAALPGMVALVALLVVWGDGHRAVGNFGFVRLFQGKAVFLLVVLPAIVLAALRFREAPRWRSWLMLALAEAAAAGLTTNALLVAPLAAGLALAAPAGCAASFRRAAPGSAEPSEHPIRDPASRQTWAFARPIAVGAAASLPLVLLAAAMYLRLAPYRGALDADLVLLGYEAVLGKERAPLALLALLALPPLAARAGLARASWIAGYVWSIVLLVLLPASGALAASTVGNVFSWRILWAIPLPLLLALAVGIAASPLSPRRGLAAVALGLWAAAFALAGPWAISSDVWSRANLARPKVPAAPHAAAVLVARVTSPRSRALVPEAVAVSLAGLPGAPSLVAVRGFYLAKLRDVIPAEDLATRASLLSFVDGRPDAPPLSRAIKLIERERIATLAFPERHRDAAGLAAALRARGFALHRVAGFVVAARPG
jgi:hypothetical protein